MMRRTWLAFLLIAVACGGPTQPNCANVGGTWLGSFANSCNQSGALTVSVSQAGCQITANIPGQGTLTGTLSGSTGSFTITYSAPCSGSASGSATVSANSIVGTYSGRAIGCCDPVSGSFTLTR